MEDEQVVRQNKDLLITETIVDPMIPVSDVVDWVLSKKKVGQLVFDVSQGKIQKASLVERTKVSEQKREATRAAAGV